jgi:hypothetical protein
LLGAVFLPGAPGAFQPLWDLSCVATRDSPGRAIARPARPDERVRLNGGGLSALNLARMFHQSLLYGPGGASGRVI